MTSNNPPRFVYKPTWVANSFLVRADKEGVRDVDPLKIQKLVYHLHGWHWAVTGSPAIGERFEAWPHGPVVASLYQKFKHYRFRRITDYATDVDPLTGREAPSYVSPQDRAFYDIFDRVWDRYKSFSGTELSEMTHARGTPWSYARENNLQYIPENKIQDYFRGLARVRA